MTVMGKETSIECNTAIYKSFIQALLLTSIFHPALAILPIPGFQISFQFINSDLIFSF